MTAIQIIGNLTADPELRFTPSATAVCNLGVVVNHRRHGADGWEDDGTTFYPVTVWGTMAENVAESLTRGTRVVVIGQQRERSYTAGDGTTRSRLEVTADEITPSLRFSTVQVTRNRGRSADAEPPR